MPKKKSDFQKRLLAVLRERDCYGCTTTEDLAYFLNSNRVAVASSCYSLVKQGLVLKHPPETQWNPIKWSLSANGKEKV